MPMEFLYLFVMLAVLMLSLLVFKRPIYESSFWAFLATIVVSNRWSSLPSILQSTATNTINYTVIIFVAFSVFMKETKVIDSCIALIFSIFGRLTGGVGYADVIANSFLGSLSGGGPQNLFVIGTMTLPAMKKAGIPDDVSANIASSNCLLGNYIPPSPTYAVVVGICATMGLPITTSELWLFMWIIALASIIQRCITIFIIFKAHNVKPIPKEELPNLKEVFKSSWKALFLPVAIALPFVIEMATAPLLNNHLSAEATTALSSALLLFVPGLAVATTWLVADKKPNLKQAKDIFVKGSSSVASTVMAMWLAMMNGFVLNYNEIAGYVSGFNLELPVLCFLVPIILVVLSLIMSSAPLAAVFGVSIITIFANAGANPVWIAICLPLLCGCLTGSTPPLSVCTLLSAQIVGADVGKSLKTNALWVAIQYVFMVITLLVVTTFK